jgi:tetratricopeptide (TPR) repeat protein
MNNLAGAYKSAGKLDLALPLFEETLKLHKAKLGPKHPSTLISMNNLAGAYKSAGKLDLALPLFEETLKLKKAKLGPDHPGTLVSMNNLAGAYQAAGKLDLALPLFEQAYRAEKKNPRHREAGSVLLLAYAQAGKTEQATALAKELLANARAQLPKESPQLAGVLAPLALSLLQAKAFTEAEPLLRECLAIREKNQPDEFTTFNTKSMLGSALLGQKKYAEAEPLLLAGYEGMKQREAKIPPPGKVRLTEALERLVQLDEALEKKDEAAKWRKELEARKEAPERLKLDKPRHETSPGTPGK